MIKRNIYLVPLLIVIIEILYAIYIVLSTDIVFGSKHYLGFLFAAICVICSIFNKGIGIYLTGIMLLIGTLNIVAFTPAIEAYSFGFVINDKSAMSIKIQLFSFLIFLLYLILNGKFLISNLRKANNNKAPRYP